MAAASTTIAPACNSAAAARGKQVVVASHLVIQNLHELLVWLLVSVSAQHVLNGRLNQGYKAAGISYDETR
ncbi:hypothetical protein BC940DRAFT_329728 [Gongronella butleri]|nr:hypothetical protein BC940DRAFT_329728 [Gongronella butleri]